MIEQKRLYRGLSVEDLITGVKNGDISLLSRAITLSESVKKEHQKMADDLLMALLPDTGKSIRLGITGVPGVGKSTFIEAFGDYLTTQGHRVAVLAVDPSSSKSGGSILGDKTRMEQLSQNPNAYIRPSPTGGKLGGVARMTRESVLLCEAAGFDVILIETVGAGQNEITVADMVDLFMVLMLPNAGDELQGIKKGVLELADLVVVNKADGDFEKTARRAARDYKSALHIMADHDAVWQPKVTTVSALHKKGMDDVWSLVLDYKEKTQAGDVFEQKRKNQQVHWMWSHISDALQADFMADKSVKDALPDVEAKLMSSDLTAAVAASNLLKLYYAR